MSLKILGTGSALPEKIVTNDDLSKTVETNDEWIRERTGIGQRHVSSQEDTVATLGAKAAVNALDMAGVDAKDIDLILLATCSADENTPSCACQVQGIIGADNAAAFDLGAACTGFMTALTVADAYLKAGTFKKILVIGAETLSRIVDWTDRGTCILFGDGAGAVVVTDGDGDDMIYSLGADGAKKDALVAAKGDYIKMDGKAVYRFATTAVPKCISDALDKAGITADDVDTFFLHQANSRIIESIAKKLGQDISKFPMNLERTGNMSSASIPVLLDEENRKGNVKKGSRLLMSGFGAGLTYGACVLTW